MRVRIVVLNWNGAHWLDGCLTALAPECTAGVEVILVDNASTDTSIALVCEKFPWVHVLALQENAGFSRGNNAGAAGAQGEYLVFLNNDTRVERGWLPALVAAADADPSIGLVTSKIVFLDRPDLIDSAGDGYLRCGGAFKAWHGQPAATAPGSREVFGACGAAFLVRRALFEALGGFDERLFMVYEDVDLSYRARLAGWRVWYESTAVVRHAGSASLGRASAGAVYYGQRNLEWVWLRNTPASLLLRSAVPHAAYGLASAVGYARAGLLGPWLRGKRAALAGLRGLWRSRRAVQGTRTVTAQTLWAAMDRGWISLKRREKRFDLSPTGVQSPRSPDN